MTLHAPAPTRVLLALVLGVCAQVSEPLTPVSAQSQTEREWRARAWALDPEAHAAELEAALASERWAERYAAMEALARSPDGTRWAHRLRERVSGLVFDPHPNVRAAALRLVARLATAPDWEPARWSALATDPWPEVRATLPVVLARRPAQDELLVALAFDRDEVVARSARRAIAGLGPERWPVQRAFFELAGTEEWSVQADVLLASGLAPELCRAQRELFGRSGASDGARASVEVLALLVGEPADRELLVRVASEAEIDPSLDSWLSAAAACEDRVLGRQWFVAALKRSGLAEARESEAVSRLLALGTDALEPLEAVERAAALAPVLPDLAIDVWQRVAPRARAWPEDAVLPWLAPERGDRLRLAVADVVARTFAASRDVGSRRILERCLTDADGSVRALAFRRLADASDGSAQDGSVQDGSVPSVLDALHGAWSRYPPGEQLEALRWLSRSVRPVPFRGALLELAGAEPTRTPSVLELLALFGGDAEVGAALVRGLEQELSDLTGSHQGHARGFVLALERVQGAAAVPLVARALEAALVASSAAGGHGYARDLAKSAAAVLGRTSTGRERLQAYLEPPAPRRVRIEAALACAPDVELGEGALQALAALERDYSGCDSELRSRVIRALGMCEGDASVQWLAGIVRDRAEFLEVRIAAQAALARRGAVDELVELLGGVDAAAVRRALDWDVEGAVVASLGDVGGDGARSALQAHWEGLTRGELVHETGEGTRLRATEVLVALLRADPDPRPWLAAVLAPPLARAAADLDARQRGAALPAVEFRWRGELDLADVLTRRGRLEDARDASGPWWRLDGRLLLELGLRALAHEDPTARSLLAGAAVALAGEPPTGRRDDALVQVHVAWLTACERASAWGDYAFVCARLLELAPRAQRAFTARLGSFDPRAGDDPWGRLVAGREQALAWQALELGEWEQARERAARASRRLGRSIAAYRAQERLEAALARERPR